MRNVHFEHNSSLQHTGKLRENIKIYMVFMRMNALQISIKLHLLLQHAAHLPHFPVVQYCPNNCIDIILPFFRVF